MTADDRDVCGITPFSLPEGHKFTSACIAHDRLYKSREDGFPTLTRSQADKALLRSMLKIAKEEKSLSLKAQAYAYYGVARIFGWVFW